jgi:hypothetical protein
MNRISERISAAIVGVTCPACGKRVRPTLVPPGPESAPRSEGDQRWSFIWRPPTGEVCPECGFPLARYGRRAKWIRLFSAGIVLLMLVVLVGVLNTVSDLPAWLRATRNVLGAIGLVAFVVGLTGIVIGGRSGSDAAER